VIHRWNKRLLQLKCEEIVNILLYKIGWFSGNLNDLYPLYEKYVIDLIACSPVQVTTLIQHLMRHILLSPQLGKRKQSDVESMRKQVIEIIDNYKRKKVEEYVLEGNEFDFVHKLLQHHPRANDKLSKLSKICIMPNENHASSSISFFVLSSEGKKEEVSYKKCFDNIASEKMHESKLALEKQFGITHVNIVKMLCKLVCVFPLMARNVINAIKSYFPYKTSPIEEQYLYFRTVLELAQV
jgi:hypothetical protein